jgi:NAD(P)H-hydrate epimerase
MKLVTSEQMRAVDRETIDNQGLPGPELMENAGRGIAERILSTIIDSDEEFSVAIFCGKGNNGGDGYVVGRYLAEAGLKIAFWHLGSRAELSDDAGLNYDRAVEAGLELYEIKTTSDLPDQLDSDYIIDAIFGTGFTGAPRGVAAELIEFINRQDQPVIAVDLPSGLNADTGQHEGEAVAADFCFTLALPKFGLYVSPGRELAGWVQTIPIGVPQRVLDSFDFDVDLITPMMVADMVPPRPADGHKGTFGKLLLVAGSTGLTGAAALAARSALRAGCGLTKIGAPATVLPIIATMIPEATGLALPDVGKSGALALRGLGQLRQVAAEHDAVAIGPGLGQHHETAELVRRLVASVELPMIIDADGLNALVGHLDILTAIKVPTALTPHPGEFQRLSGQTVPSDIHERIALARSFAAEHQVVLVLKGSPSLVVAPDGTCYLNPTGNSGMATGGSGDVLTGLIGSFLAQGMDPIEAALCGTYLHGLAGDFAAEELTERAVIAGDLIEFLPDAFSALGL